MNEPIAAHPKLAVASALLASANLPTADLTEEHCRHFFFVGPHDAPVGLVGVELLGDVALLRSLVVAPSGRKSGAGSALVRHAENYARLRGARNLYLLTTTAEAFFAKRGYATRSARCGTRRDQGDAGVRGPLPGELGVHGQTTLSEPP